jgi:hypothetical protein
MTNKWPQNVINCDDLYVITCSSSHSAQDSDFVIIHGEEEEEDDDEDDAEDQYDWSGARSGSASAGGASMMGSTINFSDVAVRRQYLDAHSGGANDDHSDSDDEANWAHVDPSRNEGASNNLGDVFSNSSGIDAFDFGGSSSAGADFFSQSPIVSPEKFDTGAGSGFFATFDQAAPASNDAPATIADPTGFFSFASFPSAVSVGPASPEKEDDGVVGGINYSVNCRAKYS